MPLRGTPAQTLQEAFGVDPLPFVPAEGEEMTGTAVSARGLTPLEVGVLQESVQFTLYLGGRDTRSCGWRHGSTHRGECAIHPLPNPLVRAERISGRA
jgi:hypothetical protein